MIRQFKPMKAGYAVMLAALMLMGCKQPAKVKEPAVNSQGQAGTVEVGIFDAVKLKDELVQTIRTGPKVQEVSDFLIKSGVTYMPNLTVPTGNVEKYLTTVEQSLANGMYRFDAYYAKAFNRQDVILQIVDIYEKLANKQGLEGELAEFKQLQEKIKANMGNKDSLDAVITDAFNTFGAKFTAGIGSDNSAIYGLLYVGANIEGMYILTQSALMAKDKGMLVEFIGRQKERMQVNYMVLEMLAADKSVEPIYLKMKPVLDVFNKEGQFTEASLKEIAPIIADIRKDIVK